MKRIVVITGAAGGIGRATVETFTREGWAVFALDRQPTGEYPEGVISRQVDVSVESEVQSFSRWLSDEVEHVDALVNNAAIQVCKPLIETTVEEWDAVMASNLRSIFLMCKELHPLLKASQGAVVNVSSVHAVATSVDIAAYAASKGASMALTRAMALEFARDGIRVNAILPGAVDTQMLRNGLGRGHVQGGEIDTRLEALGNRTVMGRVGEPAEIARTILFLADGEQSPFTTGQSLIVDGGATARLSTE
jgi:glucose 1-dehydrogenase